MYTDGHTESACLPLNFVSSRELFQIDTRPDMVLLGLINSGIGGIVRVGARCKSEAIQNFVLHRVRASILFPVGSGRDVQNSRGQCERCGAQLMAHHKFLTALRVCDELYRLIRTVVLGGMMEE